MNYTDALTFVVAHWPFLSGAALPLILSFLHARLDKFPVAKVLARYVGVLPVLRIAALELAQAVIQTWGPAPTPAVAVQEIIKAVQHVDAPVPLPQPATFADVLAKADTSTIVALQHNAGR